MLARRLRSGLTVICVGVLAIGFPSCNKSDDGGSGDDGGDEGDVLNLDDQTIIPDDSGSCDPCSDVCPCTPGDTFFNTGSCETVTCGSSGFWGGTSCLGLGCDEAGDDDSGSSGDDGSTGPTGDAGLDGGGDGTTSDAGVSESGAEAGADATSDAPSEAAPSPEGGVDAGAG